jgi:hypothetical protein
MIIQISRLSPRGQRFSSMQLNDWFVITEIGRRPTPPFSSVIPDRTAGRRRPPLLM